MSTIHFYKILLASLVIILWQLPRIKQLPSYKKKSLLIYIIYILGMVACNTADYGFVKNAIVEDIAYIVISQFIILPFLVYLTIPIIIKIAGDWKLYKKLNSILDWCIRYI